MYIEINHKKYLFIFLVLLQSLTGVYGERMDRICWSESLNAHNIITNDNLVEIFIAL